MILVHGGKLMTKKNKKEEFAVVIKEEADVTDNPVEGSPIVCLLSKKQRVKIISKPNKKFYGVGISNSVVGFVRKDDVKTE